MAKKEWLKTGADGKTFGERLEDLIKEAHITQAQLEAETGVKQSAICEYINGRSKNGEEKEARAPDCGTIIALAKRFSVSTDYLLGITTTKSADPDMQQSVAFTGLSQEAIKHLKMWQDSKILAPLGKSVAEAWSYLIAKDDVSLGFVSQLISLRPLVEEAHKIKLEYLGTHKDESFISFYQPYTEKTEQMELVRFRILKGFDKLIDDYIREYCSPWEKQPEKLTWEICDGND